MGRVKSYKGKYKFQCNITQPQFTLKVSNPERGDCFADLHIGGRIVLICILKNQGGREGVDWVHVAQDRG
jgi:hypothetical protein